jgi:hypothetical protein
MSGHAGIRLGYTIAFLNIVTSDTDAMTSPLHAVGFMYENGAAVVYLAGDHGGERRALIKLLQNARDWDLLVTWGGSIVPFITSRALYHRLEPTPIHELVQLDLRRYVGERLGLADKRLDEVAAFLHVRAKSASTSIRKRCLNDLRLVRGVFEKLRPLLRWTNPELAL